MTRAIKLTLFVFLTATTFIVGFSACQVKTKTNNDIKDEIIYHVFQRSFFDSNGDEHGDLTGIQ